MSTVLTPGSLTELAEAVRSAPRVLAVGAGTKPRLSAVEAVRISTAHLCGLVEYDPAEFTFTALAGTTLAEITAVVAERGQYLPFDPPLVDSGATLGGTVAAGLSGPGRFRFGGVRDFLLGVRMVDGSGRLLRLGGRVVKNAAGFDVPKFLVGSLGRFGVLGELTFKVFPRPASTRTVRLTATSFAEAVPILRRLARSRWEPEALDLPPGGTDVWVRLAGPEPALKALAREILAEFSGEVVSDAAETWTNLREFRWAHPNGVLVKIPLSVDRLPELARTLSELEEARVHFSCGGDVAWVSLPKDADVPALSARLANPPWSGLTLRGVAPLWLGQRPRTAITEAVRAAFDPVQRFPSLDD